MSTRPVAIHAPGERQLVRRLKLHARLDVRARPVEARHAPPGRVLVVASADGEPPRYVVAVDPASHADPFADVFLSVRHAYVSDLLVAAQVLDPKRLVHDILVAL